MFRPCLRLVIISLFVTAGLITAITMGACSRGKCSATFRFAVGINMADGYALFGHVFENVSVSGVLNCYQACQHNCRCISFNFLTTVNKDNCQLNEENRHLKSGALMPMQGSHYYDLVVDYSVKVRLGYIYRRKRKPSLGSLTLVDPRTYLGWAGWIPRVIK